jgi:predicted transcriptional regulator
MIMKKTIITLVLSLFALPAIFGQQKVNLAVGVKAPAWIFTDADKKEFTMDSWAGKVMQINYVDPDESDLNDPFNDAVKKATDVDLTLSKDLFKGIGIVDCKSTWKPNGLIRSIAGKKAKKYNTTILFDYEATLQNNWGLPEDNYTVVILDKNRVCRALYKGHIPEADNAKIVEMLIALTKE